MAPWSNGVAADQLGDTRLDGLFKIWVDEISYRKQQHHLTLVANHRTGRIVRAGEGGGYRSSRILILASERGDGALV